MEMTMKRSLYDYAKGSGEDTLLKGGDLPSKQMSVTVKIESAHEAPEGWNSPVVIRFEEPVFGKTGWAPNRTSLKLMAEAGCETLDDLAGKVAVLRKQLVNNPKTGQLTFGLIFDSFGSGGKAKPKSKPKPKGGKTDEEPF
jgi:hypothetical protein